MWTSDFHVRETKNIVHKDFPPLAVNCARSFNSYLQSKYPKWLSVFAIHKKCALQTSIMRLLLRYCTKMKEDEDAFSENPHLILVLTY